MIPNQSGIENDFEIVEQTSKTYKLYTKDNIVNGYTNGLESIKSAIYKIINTERFEHEIYSWDYGIETRDLIGKSKEYVYPELKRRISEALLQDERIVSVDSFSFASKKNIIIVLFTVHTKFGDIQTDKEVSV